MTAPNQETTSLQKQLGDGNPDGVIFNTPQKSSPAQAVVQGNLLGTITSYNANIGAAVTVDTLTAAGSNLTTTGLLTTDFIVGVTKPTAQAGIGIAGLNPVAANTTNVTFINPTAANVDTTANETYSVTAIRGMRTFSANLVPANVTATSAEEQIFDLSGSGATATANVTNGVVSEINVTAAGSGYAVNPTVVITPASNGSGSGASAVAVTANNTVVGVKITDGGSGYDVAPTVTFEGGPGITPGMVLAVNKATQANLGVGACRITGKNQVGITFINPTAANVTPTANATYTFAALNEMSAVSPVVSVTATLANLTAAAANTSNKTDVTVPGVLATDYFVNVNPAALQSPATFGGGFCAANTVSVIYTGGVPGVTPSNATYDFLLLRPALPTPVKIDSFKITPSSVANKTTAEQVFTLPTNVTLQANSTVIVNKPTFTPGISIVGARANASNEVAITYMNSTAAAITPPAEVYLMANFPSTVPSLSANQTFGACSQSVGTTLQQMIDLQNSLQQALVETGIINGS